MAHKEEVDKLKEALESMMRLKFGVCFCVRDNGKLVGILTDGDIRRKILNIQKPFSAPVFELRCIRAPFGYTKI